MVAPVLGKAPGSPPSALRLFGGAQSRIGRLRGAWGLAEEIVVALIDQHVVRCSICRRGAEKRREVDDAFTSWRSLRDIEAEFHVSKDAVLRHARACGLEARRDRNVRAALGRVIERGMETAEITGTALVSALTALAKLNSAGRLVETVSLVSADVTDLLERMNPAELEEYAVRGTLPAWAGGDDDDEEVKR